jgi:uncharacterized phage-associated protein
MLIPFHVEKVAQAAAVILKTEQSRRMSRLRLLKLLYIADRERLRDCGRPITGDTVAAMDHGPVLSRTYNLIKGEDLASPEWERFIQTVDHRDLLLVNDPGVGKLTRKEIETLHATAARFEESDDYEIAIHTHHFDEWIKNKPQPGSSRRIPLDDLLAATGQADKKAQLLADAENEKLVDDLLNSVREA